MAGDAQQKYLIWGGNGWIAGILYDMLQQQGRGVHTTTVRMENRESVMAELDRIRPTHVLNCAGVTGRPNVDWCEDNKDATIRANLVGTISLADCCALRNIHCTIYATGCE
jgi:3,5-epimerase/4-reductase